VPGLFFGGRFVALPASSPLLQFAGTHGMQ
jgi:hypothetical protein